MSFLKKLFGGTFEEHFSEGTRLFEAGSFGPAKLSFERAISKAKGTPSDLTQQAHDMVQTCKRSLAEAKIEEADNSARSGDLEDAMRLLQDASEICDDAAVAEAIQARHKTLEAMDARSLVEEVEQVDDDELLTIIAGTWSEPRAAEYAQLPEALHDGLLADHDGRHEEAVEIYKEILSRTDLAVRPCYLYLETAGTLLACRRFGEALEMAESFFKAAKDNEDAGEGMLAAYDFKSTALTELGRFDEAEESLRAAARVAPENHNTFLQLGVFLRGQKKYEQSIRMLERARELMGQMQPDISVIREMGFTYLAMGKKAEAADCFSSVIEHSASRGEHTEFDPVTALALAALYEERGEFRKAADLFRHLSVGYDTANYFMYNMEAARLLRLAGENSALVDKYLIRAQELAATDKERSALEAFLES